MSEPTQAANATNVTGANMLGFFVGRETVNGLAERLAELIYPLTIKPYATDESGKKWLAESIAYDLHIVLNQLAVPHLYCKHCGKDEQAHRYGAWCPTGGKQFEKRDGGDSR